MTSHMIPRERCDYSAIVDRPRLPLPGGVDMVVNLAAGLDARPWRLPLPPALLDIPSSGIIPVSGSLTNATSMILSKATAKSPVGSCANG